jgi:hypothetical protein
MADHDTDLKKAREIAKRHAPYVGRKGSLPENVAVAVAEGIEFGRQQGIAMAVEALRRRACCRTCIGYGNAGPISGTSCTSRATESKISRRDLPRPASAPASLMSHRTP